MPQGDKKEEEEDDDDSDLCRRDSELGQVLMTCGKLSGQASSLISRLNCSHYSSA